MRTQRRRFVVVTLFVMLAPLAMVVAAATPALAHGRGTGSGTNYSSRVVSAPDLSGVTWKVVNGDEFLSVENLSDTEIGVPGYNDGEEYLRVGPDGVFVNRNSEAYYVNQDRFARIQVPPDVGGEPDWVQVSSRPQYAWHDHRIHYMGAGLAPQIADRGQQTNVFAWTLDFTYGGEPEQLGGELVWVPGPSAALSLVPALIVVSGLALIGLRTAPDGTRTWRGLVRPAAIVLVVIALLNLTHLVDDLIATPIPLARSAVTAVQTAMFIVIGVFGAYRAWQGGTGAFTALAVGTGSIFVGLGLLYWPALSTSQIASVFPAWLIRLIVAASVVQVIPLGFVAYWGNQRTAPAPKTGDVEPAKASS